MHAPRQLSKNHGEEEVEKTVAKHKIATRQGNSQQGCKRTQNSSSMTKNNKPYKHI
jgi:hypothetical protein